MKKILIIGGMGPQASIVLHQKIIDLCVKNGAQQGNDFPEITHLSIPVPEFIDNKSEIHQALKVICRRIKTFQDEKFTHIVIACNTAHLLADQIHTILKQPVTSLIEETVHEVNKLEISKVGLLASPNTIRSKLHHQLFETNQVVVLSPREQDETSAIIHGVIAGNKDLATRLHKQVNTLLNQGAHRVLLGCTELSVINHAAALKGTIDPLDLITARILA